MRMMKEEAREHGKKVNEDRPMKEDRSFGKMGSDSAHDIQKGGGSDPRRYEAKQIIDRKVMDHDQSGYNHNGVIASPEAAYGNNAEMARREHEVDRTAEIEPDGRMGRGAF